jgi:putative transposase
VLAALHGERFIDAAPPTVYATLLDEGRYLASVPTMYRVLRAAGEVRERRRQATHPPTVNHELVAEAPNRIWSWDITKVSGAVRGTYYCLYVVLDIFSRAVVGWAITPSESAAVAQHMLTDACRRHGVQPGQLTVHADRGSPMTAKSTALLYADLGIAQSHSRAAAG